MMLPKQSDASCPHRKICVLLAAFTLLATGCDTTARTSNASSSNDNSAPSTKLPFQMSHLGPALPIEAYLIKNSERDEFNAARQIFIKQCMDSFGFNYKIPKPLPDYDPSGDSANMSRHYGITDLTIASSFGYHLPSDPSAGIGSPDPETDPSLSAAELAVMMGHENAATANINDSPALKNFNGKAVPAGGCTGDADRRLGGELTESLAEHIDIVSFQQAQNDPSVVTVLKKWSSCMQASGYDVKSIADVPGPLGESASVTPSEIQLARTDVSCKQKSDLVRVWFSAESGIEQNMIEQNQLALTDARSAANNTLAKAATIAGR